MHRRTRPRRAPLGGAAAAAGSRARRGPLLVGVSFLAALTLLLAALATTSLPQSASADPGADFTQTTANATTFGAIGNLTTDAPERHFCPSGSVLTGLLGFQEGTDYFAEVRLVCRELLSEPHYHLGATYTSDIYGNDFSPDPDPGSPSQCPDGDVVNGLAGAIDGSTNNINGLAVACVPLLSSGSVGTTELDEPTDGAPLTTGYTTTGSTNAVVVGLDLSFNSFLEGVQGVESSFGQYPLDTAIVFTDQVNDRGLAVTQQTPATDVTTFAVAAQVSFSGAVDPQATGTYPIVSQPNTDNSTQTTSDYELYVQPTDGTACFGYDEFEGGPVVCTPQPIPLDQWLTITGSFDGANVSIDVDGIPTSVAYTPSIARTFGDSGTPDLLIGQDYKNGPGNVFSGAIDDVTEREINTGDMNVVQSIPLFRYDFDQITFQGEALTPVSAPDLVGQGAPAATFIGHDSSDQPAIEPHVDQEAQNYSWVTAQPVNPTSSVTQAVTQPGEARWYKVPISPDGKVTATVSHLAFDADVTLFGDIGAAFTSLTSQADLTHVAAEFAPSAFSPSAFSPSAFSPSAFSPSAFSPSAFSPSAFSPSAFSSTLFAPSAFSPSAFSPSAFSPSAFSPSAFSPSAFSPSAFSPSAFSPSAFSPSAFSESTFQQAFSSAQTRSLLDVAPGGGRADRTVSSGTYAHTGYYYIRVQGRNGISSSTPFTLQTTVSASACTKPPTGYVDESTLSDADGSTPANLIITDSARFSDDTSGLQASLTALATTEDATVVDVSGSQKVTDLFAQADADPLCLYDENLTAQAIRDVVNSYRGSGSTLKTVTLVGGDRVIPFFRYPDLAGLAPESGYVPPVLTPTASETSLATSDVLSQVAYGSALDVTQNGVDLPVADVAVGRLVESAADVERQIAVYTGAGGQVITPTSSLTTGYDFLADDAHQVASTLAAGDPGGTNDTLITNQGVPPTTTTVDGKPDAEHSWTAADLRTALFSVKHDIVFLAGHFSANNTEAADFATTVNSTEVPTAAAAVPGLFTNTLVFSAGCHSAYNLQDSDAVPGYSEPLDWAQALTTAGATLVGGTGYQYGDTDFVLYSEKIYAGFAAELQQGTGPVGIGAALLAADHDYLDSLTTVTGMDEKAYLEATLYGVPTKAVDEPGRSAAPTPLATVPAPTAVAAGPGNTLGLTTSTVDLQATSTTTTTPATGAPADSFTYLTGTQGVDSTPSAPVLPLDQLDATEPGTVLRGVGFRSGSYSDTGGVLPLTGAPTTELNGPHPSFDSPAYYPQTLDSVNYFGALDGSSGRTTLSVTPAQYEDDAASPGLSTQRSYSDVGLQLFYSGNTSTYGTNVPALAAPPTITEVSSTTSDDGSGVTVSAHVTGDPSAGIQDVWVTYTGVDGPLHGSWQSVDLTQSTDDTTLWTGTIPLDEQNASDVRFELQAVNGVGEVGADNAGGYLYTPGPGPALNVAGARSEIVANAATVLAGSIGDTVTESVHLDDVASNLPIAGAPVAIAIGSSPAVAATTDENGDATARIPLAGAPGSYDVTASFDGDATHDGSSASLTGFTLSPERTSLALSAPATAVSGTDPGITATLTTSSAGLPLLREPVTFTVTDGTAVQTVTRTTDPAGMVQLGPVLGAPGEGVQIVASFAGPSLDGTFAAASASQAITLTGTPVLSVVSGSGQSAGVSSAFGAPVVVQASDGAGNPVAGVAVRFVGAGLATLPSASADGSRTVYTAADGTATSPVLTAGASPGAETLTAHLVGASDVTATLTAVSTAASIVMGSGNAQAAQVAGSFGAPLVVTVTDGAGNPVVGQTVTFSAPAASATFSATTAVTDGSGVATSVIPVAGKVAGTFTVSATTGGLSTTFTESDVAGMPAYVYPAALPSLSLRAGRTGVPLAVLVTDSFGNPVPGTAITFAAPAAGSGVASVSFGGSSSYAAMSNSHGVAYSSAPTASTTAGAYVVTATSPNVRPASFSAANLFGVGPFAPPVTDPVSANAPPGVFPLGGTVPVSIQLLDASGNPLSASAAQQVLSSDSVRLVLTDTGTRTTAAVTPTGDADAPTSSFAYDTGSGSLVYQLQGTAAKAVAGHVYLLTFLVVTRSGVALAIHSTRIAFQ